MPEDAGEVTYFSITALVLLYAAISLPSPSVLILSLMGIVGPNTQGSAVVDAIGENLAAAAGPIGLVTVATSVHLLAINHRKSEEAMLASESRLFSILDSMPLGVFVLSSDGSLYYSNDSARRLVGPPAADIAAGNLTTAYEVRSADNGAPYPEQRLPAIRALSGETSVVDDIELVRDGEPINLQFWGAPIRDDAGQITHTVSAISNITAQKRFEAALQESEARFRTVFEEGPLGMAILDADDRFVQVNQALCSLTGYRGDELAVQTLTEITHLEDRGLDTLAAVQRGEAEILDVEERFVRKDGETVWVRVCLRVLQDVAKDDSYKLLMVQDVSERRRAEALIEHMAYADALTDLPNRRLFYDRLQQAIARARRHGGGLVVLSVDLDDFNSVNGRFGHDAGDALLIETAARLRSCLRDSDTVARMGADEFVALLTDTNAQAAAVARDRIATRLAQPIEFAGVQFSCTVSTGLASFGPDGETSDSLVRAATARMAEDKADHRLAHTG